jgi:endo-1,4-beta-xylanase
MTRRRAVLLGLGTLAGMGTATVTGGLRQLNNQKQALGGEERNFALVGDTPLRDRAAAKGIIYGAAAFKSRLSSDQEFATRFARECAILVPEGELKWQDLRPDPDRFNFAPADWLAEFARTHNMLFRGHTLVWHEALPKWFAIKANRQNAEQIMLEHISTVVGHYAGKIHSWDVVNEAVLPKDGRSDGLRNTPWLELLGPDYIDIAFRAAAQADPKALLVYNDHWLEYDLPECQARRVAVIKLLERLKSRGSPVQALGIQAHLFAAEKRFNPTVLRNFLRDVADLGLKILITEMDVADKNLPLDIPVRDRLIAEVYEDYLSVVLDEPAVIAVLTWGLSDRYTWFPYSKLRLRDDKAPSRPLPLDTELNRKLAWNAIARAFDKAPRR